MLHKFRIIVVLPVLMTLCCGTKLESEDAATVIADDDTVESCPRGFILCDDRCIDPLQDRYFCGASETCTDDQRGEVCVQSTFCDQGSCVGFCQLGYVNCDDSCVDPLSNRNYCGAVNSCQDGEAGVECEEGIDCIDGLCQLICPDGQLACGPYCVSPSTDSDYCGASGDCLGGNSGEVCAPDESCNSGVCEMSL